MTWHSCIPSQSTVWLGARFQLNGKSAKTGAAFAHLFTAHGLFLARREFSAYLCNHLTKFALSSRVGGEATSAASPATLIGERHSQGKLAS